MNPNENQNTPQQPVDLDQPMQPVASDPMIAAQPTTQAAAPATTQHAPVVDFNPVQSQPAPHQQAVQPQPTPTPAPAPNAYPESAIPAPQPMTQMQQPQQGPTIASLETSPINPNVNIAQPIQQPVTTQPSIPQPGMPMSMSGAPNTNVSTVKKTPVQMLKSMWPVLVAISVAIIGLLLFFFVFR